MKDYISLIIVCISNVISIIVVFNKEQGKEEMLQDEYFSIINSYFQIKNINADINPIEYFGKLKHKKVCIPPYIFYLVEKNQREKLEKILKVDYWNKYPNVVNNTHRVIDKFGKILYFFGYIFVTFIVCYTLATIYKMLQDVEYWFKGISINGFILFICLIAIMGIICCSSIYFLKQIIQSFGQDIDDYSCKNKTIEKKIKNKLNEYEKKENTYYFYS